MTIVTRIQNLTIRAKLIIAFVALIVVIAGMGAISIDRMSVMHSRMDESEITATAMSSLDTLRAGALSYRTILMRALILRESGDTSAQREAAIENNLRAKKDAEAIYIATIGSDEEERAIYRDHQAAWSAYFQSSMKLRELLTAQKYDEAIMTFRNETAALALPVDATIQRSVEHNKNELHLGAVSATESYAIARQVVLVLLLLAALVALLAGWALVRLIAVPIRVMTAGMLRLASHDMTADIPGLGRRDEVGAMAGAVKVFKDNMIKADKMAVDEATNLAARERRQAALEQHTQDFGASISGVMASLAIAADTMRDASQTMADAVDTVRGEAGHTSVGADGSARDLTAVAAAVEELTSSVGEISRQVSTAADVARQAVRRADASQGIMEGLTGATMRIGDVVSLINDIAGQTNLLALNATIEAARAGDSGRGFAVVAGEVKALAAQTAKATAEIGGQIAMVRDASKNAVEAMSEIGAIIGRLDEVSTAISAAVEEQSTTTKEIAGSIQAVSAATAATAQAMTHIVEVVDGSGEASHAVLAGSGQIGREATTLRTEVDQFLIAVRSDKGERRGYERVLAHGETAILRAAGRTAKAVLVDISRGGAVLECDWQLPAGTSIEIDLPGGEDAVTARVVRGEGGRLALVFGSEPSILARVDRALDTIGGYRAAA